MDTPAPHRFSQRPADSSSQTERPSKVSAADQQAFNAATLRLRKALEDSVKTGSQAHVAEARVNLRSLAVKLRDAGFWKSDKQGLRATVSLLWEADRFVSDHALLQPGKTEAR